MQSQTWLDIERWQVPGYELWVENPQWYIVEEAPLWSSERATGSAG